ncbi:MAG TPA: monovalent cation:proton antiporter-2 (CPA2) family protein [Xanthomonadaceae bacterium]|nr:monovalent cation:proton antiporter-2 (CPA2) family protein [Xanthomonadaceae bacterium]
MLGDSFLDYTLVFLLATVVAVPLFRALGLGAVLGYLVAGIALGPDLLGVFRDPEEALAISEFGVVMMLFIIGLELSPSRLWLMRRQVFGAGTAQVLASALVITPLLLWWGLGPRAAVLAGIALALSSTAVGLQLLAENRELNHVHGRTAFAILLFQDLAAIPLIAAVPLLGVAAAPPPEGMLEPLLYGIGAIAVLVIGGRYVLRYLFAWIARTRSIEVFSAATLLVVAGSAWLMHTAGLSMGLGAFLAGVLLAESEFRHELESHIEPFKGLLLGLFFMAVGMSIDLDVLEREPQAIALGVLALLAIKTAVLFAVGRGLVRLRLRATVLLCAVLAMGGEFAFVVFSEALRVGLIVPTQRDVLVVIVGISMAMAPLFLVALRRLLPVAEREAPPQFDPIDAEQPRVIIAGFGRFGQVVGRLLSAHRIPYTALEHSPEQVEVSRRFGSTIFYGDPSRPELLRAAGADKAEIFVLATDDPEQNVHTARLVRRLYPNLKLYARARNRQHAFRLMDLRIDGIVRETLFSSLELGRQVLMGLGQDAETSHRRVETFRRHDESLLLEQHLVYDDETRLIESAAEARDELRRLFEADARSMRDRDTGD